ncbi:MAG: major facilitator transporter [Methylocystaceae bacterium]|nr:MAG: major facilitator transporter [Methylocystaceae bacterium]KAF0212164.1 MAG: major facilitator [Methylocystaceae bacterium]TXT44044.1 MAG: major facilitator transporter [Methylocystaceae bacterium]
MTSLTTRQIFSGLSRNTFLLALASLFADISTEMLYPILPVFLTQTLHATGSVVGLVEGFAQAAQNVVQGFSGALSDKLQKRKPIALLGYFMAALGKPLMGVATVWPAVFGARFLDRLGSGIRSAPRDALIASSVDDENRGRAFGLEGIGDNAGAFLGPILAAILLYSLQVDMRTIFYVALIPGLLAFFMVLLVTERPAAAAAAKSKIDASIWQFPKRYWAYLLVTALFNLGNSSNSFLILRTQDLGVSLETTILIYAGFNLIAALISYPAGALSDRFGRKNILLASFVIFGVAYLGFALATGILMIAGLFVFYGLYEGIFRSVGKAFASDFVPEHLRGGGIGWFSTTVGLLQLIASIVAGLLWDKVGHTAVFYYGVGSAVLGSLALLLLVPSRRNPRDKKGEGEIPTE